MSDGNCPPRIFGHVAVPLGEFILVFSGAVGNFQRCKAVSKHIIWMYHCYTEQWRKYIIPESKLCPPNTAASCAVAIKDYVLLFGGFKFLHKSHSYYNDLWKLSKSPEGLFSCSKVITDNMNVPSPRCDHSGWTYSGKLWTFGGFGPSIDGYLNDNNEYLWSNNDTGYNNQLLSFNPSSKEWLNLTSSGSIPSPRAGCALAITRNKVWLHGGNNYGTVFDELYEFNMSSLIWTHVQTANTKPQGRSSGSLNAITHDQLLLHGGNTLTGRVGDTWIFDLSSKTWKQYKSEYPRACHTASTGINSNSIIIGGCRSSVNIDSCDGYKDTFCIMLEPRSLQQLAMQIIYKHQNSLSLKCLPPKLITLLGMAFK